MKDDTRAKPLPREVYKELPDRLRKMCIGTPGSDAVRDMFLLGSLGVISGLLPNVRFKHDMKLYSPHLFVIISSNAGTGKAICGIANELANKTDERIHSASKAAIEEWKVSQIERSQNSNIPEIPKPPDLSLRVGADTTAAAISAKLALHPEGVLMFSTEIDTLGAANSARDHGNFSDLLRKAYHHEPHMVERKGDGTTRVPNPRLAILMTGTKRQFPALLNNNTEDGTLSRFLYLQNDELPKYRSPRPTAEGMGFKQDVETYSESLNHAHSQLSQRQEPLCITMSNSGWDYLDLYCERAFTRELSHNDGALISVVGRASVNTMRIASILSVLRLIDAGKNLAKIKSVEVSANDLATSLDIALTCADHLKGIAGKMDRSLAGSPSSGDASQGPVLSALQVRFQDKLPEGEFQSAEMLSIAESLGIKQSKAYRWIKELPLITREDHGTWSKNGGLEFQEDWEIQEKRPSLFIAEGAA